jgi:hypothetical protein
MAHELLVLDDAVLLNMLRDLRYRAAIPCFANGQQLLNNLQTVQHGCSGCRRKRSTANTTMLLSQVRQCIVALPAVKRAELKQLAQAKQMRVIRPNNHGGMVRITF